MSTSDTKKAIIVTIILSACALAVNYIYSLFGHGINSFYMEYLFLVPLLGGTLVYSTLYIIKNKFLNRLAFNIYNSGLAILACGFILKGIFEIAGTSSIYLKYYFIIGIMLSLLGLFLLICKKSK